MGKGVGENPFLQKRAIARRVFPTKLRFMDIHTQKEIVRILKEEAKRFRCPYVSEVSSTTKDPFRVLVSCILSLRTKDPVTKEATTRLFKLASTPKEMALLREKDIERAIYPVGFYRNKARIIKEVSKEIVERYDSRVPDTIEELLKLRGVGRKTANLVVTMGYGKPGICVDTHVHRITNRWGLVSTRTPHETEFALRDVLHKRYWKILNSLLVAFGQNICKPVSPICSQCRLSWYCKKKGVKRMR